MQDQGSPGSRDKMKMQNPRSPGSLGKEHARFRIHQVIAIKNVILGSKIAKIPQQNWKLDLTERKTDWSIKIPDLGPWRSWIPDLFGILTQSWSQSTVTTQPTLRGRIRACETAVSLLFTYQMRWAQHSPWYVTRMQFPHWRCLWLANYIVLWLCMINLLSVLALLFWLKARVIEKATK